MRFVFVHGGFHAAWCWERTIAELQALGHTGVAVDLPGHGARVDDESTLANRRDAIVSALEANSVLVGHSGGGFDATLAADAAPDLAFQGEVLEQVAVGSLGIQQQSRSGGLGGDDAVRTGQIELGKSFGPIGGGVAATPLRTAPSRFSFRSFSNPVITGSPRAVAGPASAMTVPVRSTTSLRLPTRATTAGSRSSTGVSAR